MPLKIGDCCPSFNDGELDVLDSLSADMAGLTNCSALLVYFWAMSCPSCHRNMPELQQLRDGYADAGLKVVAVHRPRGSFDLDKEEVAKVAEELGVTELCLLDHKHAYGDQFGIHALPTYFLFDSDMRLRRHAVGNFGVRMIKVAIEKLLSGKNEENYPAPSGST